MRECKNRLIGKKATREKQNFWTFDGKQLFLTSHISHGKRFIISLKMSFHLHFWPAESNEAAPREDDGWGIETRVQVVLWRFGQCGRWENKFWQNVKVNQFTSGKCIPAACFTHPLDLLKVTLQTQQEGKLSVLQLTGKVIRTQGVLALYNGISASLMRQLTYSTTRFGIYEMSKQHFGKDIGFVGTILLAGSSGAAGGFIGTPADLVNFFRRTLTGPWIIVPVPFIFKIT